MYRTRFLGHPVTLRGLTQLVFLARFERRAVRQLLETPAPIVAFDEPGDGGAHFGQVGRPGDSTAIEAREKPAAKEKAPPPPKRRRGRPKKGEQRPRVLKRLDRQATMRPAGDARRPADRL